MTHSHALETSHRRSARSAAGAGASRVLRGLNPEGPAERALVEAHDRFESAFANAPIGMALVAPDGRFLQVNRSLCALMGRSETELMQCTFHSISHPENRAYDAAMLERVLAGEAEKGDVERRYLLPNGVTVWARVSVSLTRDAEGSPRHFISQFQDITKRKTTEQELRRYTEHLKELALQDPLTGLGNYQAFHAAVEGEIARARPGGTSFSVVLFDLDRFKAVNDIHGHQAGDRVLSEVGAALRRISRTGETPARIGGDEFGLVLPLADEAAGTARAERLKAIVAGLRLGAEITYGVAAWSGGTEGKDRLLQRADQALYAAKPHRAGHSGPASANQHESSDHPGVRRVLTLAREQLGVEVTYLAEFRDGQQHYRSFDGDPRPFGVEPGDALPLSETYCQRMIDGDLPHVVGDARRHPIVKDLPVTHDAGIGSYIGVPLHLSDGRLYGTLCAISHTANPELGQRDVDLMSFLAEVLAERLEHDELTAERQRAESELAGIRALMAALEARDQYTGEHSQTVVDLASKIARQLDLSEPELREVEQIALLHDIGKVGMPDALLQKEGPLNDEEWELMRQHPDLGARILAGTTSLGHLAPGVRAEHERWDGSGYPDGLRGEQIPIASRITLVCDAYHAMTSDRPYRQAMPVKDAIRELRANAGTQFDPRIVETLTLILQTHPAGSARRA